MKLALVLRTTDGSPLDAQTILNCAAAVTTVEATNPNIVAAYPDGEIAMEFVSTGVMLYADDDTALDAVVEQDGTVTVEVEAESTRIKVIWGPDEEEFLIEPRPRELAETVSA